MEKEVIMFLKGGEVATIVSNGEVTRVYTSEGARPVSSIGRGVSFLESRGYSVCVDMWG